MLRDVLIVMRYELLGLARSARIWLAAALYAAAGLIGGLVYVLSVRAIEKGVMKAAVQQGASAYVASQSMGAMGDQAYRKLIEFFADGDQAMVAALIDVPPILLFSFWATLTFMPFFLVLFAFDQMAADLQHRSLSFPLLRVSRPTLYAGKLAAHGALYLGLVLLLSAVLFGMGWALLDTFDLGAALLFSLRSLALLVPFGACYLALIALVSSLTRSPFLALLGCVGALVGLSLLGLFSHLADASQPWALLQYLAWLSPSHWEAGLWSPRLAVLGPAVGAYLAFAAGFSALGVWRLQRQDL